MYGLILHSKTLHFAHTMYLCISYYSHNKQIILLNSINILVSIMVRQDVYCEVGTAFSYYADERSGCNCWFVSVGCGQTVALSVLLPRRDRLPRRSSGMECSRLTDLCIDSAEFIKVKCGQPLNDNNWDGWSVSVPDRERLLIRQDTLYWYLMVLFLLLRCLWSRWCRCKGKLLV
jgi:hypothetical protein